MACTIMTDEHCCLSPPGLLRLQTWHSPTFPIGSYSYSHGIEWAVEAGNIIDRATLVDWLQADLCHGSGRNEAIFFSDAARSATTGDCERLLAIAETAAAMRGTPELALESSQPAAACLMLLSQVWPDVVLHWLSERLRECGVRPSLAVLLGIQTARQGIPVAAALPLFLQSYVANFVIAGVRLIPLGQTDGQLAIAELEEAVLAVSAEARTATTEDLGSAAIMVDLASIAHETQYSRLFRS